MKVGILELLTYRASNPWAAVEAFTINKQFASVTCQAVSVWCRELGHRVHYATYYGLGDPRAKLPGDLDLVFIAAATMMAPLAYALARRFARENTRSVIGGPHAKSFPDDCQRYFDVVVLECDKALVRDVLDGQFEPGSVVSSRQPYEDAPTVEQRMPEIRASNFLRGHAHPGSFIPLLASMGCPYTCDFCVDWNSRYRALPTDRLAEDLSYAARRHRGVPLAIMDPNFGVRFDETLDVFESVPPDERSPYAVESSLTILRPDRLERLRDTRCAAMSPGIESWSQYSNKAAVGNAVNRTKLDHVVEHFHLLRDYVPYLGANFIFGLDPDSGDEPFALTKEFLMRTPFVWPSVNSPFPFGGTPVHRTLLEEGRILTALPFNFYTMPYLAVVPKHYDPLAFVEKMIDVYRLIGSPEMLESRMASIDYFVGKGSFLVHTWIARHRRRIYEALLRRMRDDPQMSAFHRGESDRLPEFYALQYRRQLGKYASWVPLDAGMPLQTRDLPVAYTSSPRGRPGEAKAAQAVVAQSALAPRQASADAGLGRGQ